MVELLVTGVSIDQALPLSYKDPVVKERFFVTPLAIGAAAKRPAASSGEEHQAQRGGKKRSRAQAFPKSAPQQGKGRGKGSRRKGQGQCAAETPDGKKICYKFNDQSRGCHVPRCNFLHVCGKCFKDHPLFRCDA